MPRCLACGRRWIGAAPVCGHAQTPQLSTSASEPKGTEHLGSFQLPGYCIDDVIGRGGFGTVFAAKRESDGQVVAIKVVHRNYLGARERLLLEAHALKAIGPPYVPELYEASSLPDGSPYLIFEYLHGSSLDVKLAEWGKPLDLQLFQTIADAILISLEMTHNHGFVHRDIKPENIFLQEKPVQAKLIDFGIAKQINNSSTELTNGLALGTPEYMSPEQCRGQVDIDLRADIYAAGVVLYEMLTGRPPFFGGRAEVREAHVAHRPPRPSRVAEVSPIFDEILLRCLAKDRSRRFDGAKALRRALAHAGQHIGISTGATQPTHAQRSTNASTKRMGLLFIDSARDVGKLKQALTTLGGYIMALDGDHCVAVFSLEVSGSPVQRAFDSARAILNQGICSRILVDHDRVQVRRRSDGSLRLFSVALMRPERFPRPSDPAGVLITESAAEALPDLPTILVREGVYRQDTTDSDTSPDATTYQLGTSHLVGRSEPFWTLVSSATLAIQRNKPTLATVLGEPGLGKSHLSAAVLDKLAIVLPHVRLVRLRAREPLGGENYETLRALLRAVLDLPRLAPPDNGRTLLVSRLGDELGPTVWAVAAMALGWLDTDQPEIRKLRAAPAALRSAAMRAAGEALIHSARKQPLCFVLDDAHFADEATLDALEYATLTGIDVPLWVCILAIPSFERARPAWGMRATQTERIHLSPLENENAAELFRHLLKPVDNISQATIQRFVDQTRGSPLLIFELVRGIKKQGLIRRHTRGDSWYLANDEIDDQLGGLPQVEWLAQRELGTLSSELTAHAQLLALLGSEFNLSEVEGVLAEIEIDGFADQFLLDAQVGIQRLIEQGLLITHRDGRYSFRHQLIRDHVAQTISSEVRHRIHQAAFRFYSATESMPDFQRMPRLAQHAAKSGQSRIASIIYLSLADNAASNHSYVDAELMFSRAISLLVKEDLQGRLRAYNGRGLMRYRLSRFEDALKDLDQARTIARQLDDIKAEIEVILDEATVLDWMRDFRKSKALVEEARQLALRSPSPLIEARISMAMGRTCFRFRDWDDALFLLQSAIIQAKDLGDAGYETFIIALLLLGLVQVAVSSLDEAKNTFDRAITLCEERGDRLHLAGALTNRSDLWVSYKNVEQAAADSLRCQQIGREIGQGELEYAGAFALAELYYFAGDLKAVRPHISHAVEVEPNNANKPLSLLLQGRIHVYAGELTEARSVIERIHKLQDESRRKGDVDALFIESEQVLFHMIHLAALDSLPEGAWDELRKQAEQVSQLHELAEVIEMMALAAERHGQRDKAIHLLGEALTVFQRRSHLIEDRIARLLRSLQPQ